MLCFAGAVYFAVAQNLLVRLFRRSDVGLVTPLHDGMNLVAKEYIAAQAAQLKVHVILIPF